MATIESTQCFPNQAQDMVHDASLELAAAMVEAGDNDSEFLLLLMQFHERYRADAILSISLGDAYSFSDPKSVDTLFATYQTDRVLLQTHRVLLQAEISRVLLRSDD